MTGETNNNSGAKAFGCLAALAALIMAMAAIVRPMQQQITALEISLSDSEAQFRHDIDAHTDNFSHRTIGSDIAKLQQQFAEVETQFRGLRELTDARLLMARELTDARLLMASKQLESIEDWLDWWHKTVPGLDARQNTRLEALERKDK